MSCNSCAKPYSLFRKEKGCLGCGFSYCTKCLVHKKFVTKLNTETKVCAKCKNIKDTNQKQIFVPPDAYFKRIATVKNEPEVACNSETSNSVDQEIQNRLLLLKANKINDVQATDEKIMARLQSLKGPQPSTSDAELHSRLALLKGVSLADNASKDKIPIPTLLTKTEQEQTEELLQQYLEQYNLDKQYKEGFQKQIQDIGDRIKKLKGSTGESNNECEADLKLKDEEHDVKKIIEKVIAESSLDNIKDTSESIDELPFCEICNEDAKMRCLGCRYLFCKRCFLEHRDDDDGCDKYELYQPSKQ